MKLRNSRQIDMVLAEDKMSEFAGAVHVLNSRVSALKEDGEGSYCFGNINLSFSNWYWHDGGDPPSWSNKRVVKIRCGLFCLYRRSKSSDKPTRHYLNVSRALKCLSEFDGIVERIKVQDAERESRKKLSLQEKQDRQNSNDDAIREFINKP